MLEYVEVRDSRTWQPVTVSPTAAGLLDKLTERCAPSHKCVVALCHQLFGKCIDSNIMSFRHMLAKTSPTNLLAIEQIANIRTLRDLK